MSDSPLLDALQQAIDAAREDRRRAFRDQCNACDKAGDDRGLYDYTRCIEGRVYGECGHERCGGVCEYVGECGCRCHAATDGAET